MRALKASGLFFIATVAWADLTVRVVDPSGASVPDATVVLRGNDGVEVARGVTSLSGVAEFSASARSVDVMASGFQPETVAATGMQDLQVHLALAPVAGEIGVNARLLSLAIVASEEVEPSRQARPDLVESLKETPHVHLVRRGGINFEPVVQGLRETQLAMIVDGTRTFAAGPARMDSELSHVDPGTVASVRVVAGPYALAEGAGAMAAILVDSDPVPRPQRWRVGGRGGLGWRSNGAARIGHTRVHAGNPGFGVSLRAAGDLLDDYSAGSTGGVATAPVPGDAAAHQLGARVRVNPSPNQELLVSGFYDEQTGVDYPGRLLTAEHFLLRSWQASYRWARPDGVLSSVKFRAYLNKKSHRMSNEGKPTAMDMPGRMPPFALDVSLPTEADTFGVAGRVELSPSDSWRVQTGWDFFRLQQEAQRFIARASNRMLLFNDTVWAGTSLRNLGTYAHVGRSFRRGEVRAAVRLDFVGSDAGRPSEYFLANSGPDSDRTETNANFSLAGRYELGGGLTLAGGAGRVVRTANALERYSDRFPSTRFQVAAEFMGNPDVRPESSLQGDLGVEWAVRNFRFSAGGFVRSIGDYITVMPDSALTKRLPLSPPAVFRYVNGTSAFFRGWNVGVRRSADWLELRARAFKTIADDRQLVEPVLGIAPLELDATVRVVQPGRRWWAEYGLRNVWEQQRISTTRMETPSPGFMLHAIRLGVNLREGTILHMGMENLGDRYYSEHLNSLNPFTRQRIPEMGRTVTLAFTTEW